MAREPLGATLNSIHNLAFYLDIMERVRKELAGINRAVRSSASAASISFAVRAMGRPMTLK